MFKRSFRLPSPALVISMVALALVLGGTAVAASVSSDKAADTKLVKKLAPSLSVKHARAADTATAIEEVSYSKGNVVDAPANGGSGFGESSFSEAGCPGGTIVIGTAASAGEGVVANPAGIVGNEPTIVKFAFDNFTNVDEPNNYAIAICAPAPTWANIGFAGRNATKP